MPRVVHFELAADNVGRAADFYAAVFGWKAEGWGGQEDFLLVSTGDRESPGIDGSIAKRSEMPPVIITIDVPSVEVYLEKVVDAGGSIVMPKVAIPGVGYLAYCKDTEGIVFGIMHSDMTAK
jgi:predicted enzyme related to lactoylglutathione lyase